MPNRVATLLLRLSGMRVVNVRRRCTGDRASVTCLNTMLEHTSDGASFKLSPGQAHWR